MKRLFLGIPVEASARAALAENAQMLMPGFPGRYTHPDHYHITLAFIGETEERLIPVICMAMRECAAEGAIFTVFLGPIVRKADMLWCEAQAGGHVALIGQALAKRLRAHKIHFDEKQLCPHITLARKVVFTSPLNLPTDIHISFTVDSMTLFESSWAHSQVRYTPIAQERFT